MEKPKDIAKEILWYGKTESSDKSESARAGVLDISYTLGNLRDIRIGEHEIIRMIYVSLRDRNWGTIIPNIENESIRSGQSDFFIEYDAVFQKDEISFKYHVTIEGDDNNKIVFEIRGEALTDFRTNRNGFCVLHPIEPYSGLDCIITNSKGEKITGSFPKYISPHQPMKDIIEMSWEIGDSGSVKLIFEGEIFETEDQRNWTDDSYKTYCRPLELPFPYKLKKGEKTFQRITLSVQNPELSKDSPDKEYRLSYDPKLKQDLPKIGIGKSTLKTGLSEKEAELISNVNFDFYEANVVFVEDWKPKLERSVFESKDLNLPLKLKAVFSENFQSEIEQLSAILTKEQAAVDSILILESKAEVTSDGFISKIIQSLKKVFPTVKFGAGTSKFFAELNRNRISCNSLDFVSFSVNPQVHAFDNQSLVETLNGQSAVIQSARQYFDPKEIHVSSVTFKIQKDIEHSRKPGHDLYSEIDERQMSLFGAAWVLGSIKHMAEEGADALTYFETVGEKGIMQGEKGPSNQQLLPTEAGAVFPMYYIFEAILQHKNHKVLHSISSHPQEFEGLILDREGKKIFLLCNFTDAEISVRIDDISPDAKVKKLDEKSALRAMYENKAYSKSPFCDFNFEQPITTIKMRPYAFVIIEE